MLILTNTTNKVNSNNEIELFELFPNFEDLISVSKEELGGILLKELIEVKKRPKNHSMDRVFLGLSCFKYHNLKLQEPQNRGVEDEIEKAITEAWKWLERENYIALNQGSNILNEYVYITSDGDKAGEQVNLSSYIASNQYPWKILHPDIKDQVAGIFRQGNYSTAVFDSFKQVEVYLRDVYALDDKICGKELIGRAFPEKNGKLKYTKEERESLIAFFQGAMGLYRNPNGHKNVDVISQDAFHQIMMASLLLKEIDTRKL